MRQELSSIKVLVFSIFALLFCLILLGIKFIKPHFSDEHFVAEMKDSQSGYHFKVVCQYELPVDYVTYIYVKPPNREPQKIRVAGAGDILEDCTTGMRKVTALNLVSERNAVLVEFQNAPSVIVPIRVNTTSGDK